MPTPQPPEQLRPTICVDLFRNSPRRLFAIQRKDVRAREEVCNVSSKVHEDVRCQTRARKKTQQYPFIQTDPNRTRSQRS